ncbi:pyridoxal phosphate-dependent transferase [Aspergillus undulatus]|uniref:pyridoxal phosphate-dependent transferase n=1 Tax=Aspergillus undulatus TaxID=1810928 RepID=UPI003CCD2572
MESATGANGHANGAVALPDHDFHNAWGCVYSGESTLKHGRMRQLWHEYGQNPAKVERKYHSLLSEYTLLFRDFFQGYYPISLHAHVSDALLPTTVASLILNTCSTSPAVLGKPGLAPTSLPTENGKKIQDFVLEYLGWNQLHLKQPKFAIIPGIYGAAFGPLAHASKEWEYQIIASGPKPTVLCMTESPQELSKSLRAARKDGCVAVVVDMVSTEDGAVLPPERFKMLQKCCAEQKMWLIVDEALTAIRCGAPFAFQRSEYGDDKPDLVSFGKGMGVSGVAINFDGPMTRQLGVWKKTDVLQSIMYWRAMVSRPIVMPVLLNALGILYTAQLEDWPQRSLDIRAALCDIIHEYHPNQAIHGLGGLIAIDRKISMPLNVMSAVRRRCPFVRWLPKLDAPYADREALRTYVFGTLSRERRAHLSAEADRDGTMPAWCYVCGIESTSQKWCRTCFLGLCENEVCEESFRAHTCL